MNKTYLQNFIFGFIGVFLPLGFVAFIRQSFLSLFTLLYITIVFDQLKVILQRVLPQVRFIYYTWKVDKYKIKDDASDVWQRSLTNTLKVKQIDVETE